MYMKKHFNKALAAILFAGILSVSSCSLWEEDIEPAVPAENGKGELIEYSCQLSSADFMTKTSGVDDLPNTFLVGVYDIIGTKVGVISSSGSLALYKYAKYSFYAVGGAVTDYTFPTSESDIADLPVMYNWYVEDPDDPSVSISEDGAPVYGSVKGVTPASIASGTVLHIPVERKIAKFNLTVNTDSTLRKYFNAPSISVNLCNANLGFFTESSTYTTNCADVITRFNNLQGESYSTDGYSFNAIVSGSMSASGSSPNLCYTWNRVFAVPENRNGNLLSSNTDPALKNEDSIDELDVVPHGVTYIVLRVTYTGSNGVSGTMIYRFYPGLDNTSNFDIIGGKTYNITCTLSYNGLFADATWKVNADGMTDTRNFTMEKQTQNYVKGDTLWVKMSYIQNGTSYTINLYKGTKYAVFTGYSCTLEENETKATEWSDYNVNSPYGGNCPHASEQILAFPTYLRRTVTCTRCGNVVFGAPAYNGTTNWSYVYSWAASHYIKSGTVFSCAACGYNLFSASNANWTKFFVQTADGATYNSNLQFGTSEDYEGFPISGSYTQKTWTFAATTYDGKVRKSLTCPIGYIDLCAMNLTGDYNFYVAQKRTITMNVTKLASALRSTVTFTATLTPQGGGSTSDVSSWLSSSYNSTTNVWTVTVSAKAPGNVTIQAYDSSSDLVGETDITIFKPSLVCRDLNVDLYASGELRELSIFYYDNSGKQITTTGSPVNAQYGFDRTLYSTYLRLTQSTSMLYSGLVSAAVNGTYHDKVYAFVSGFNGNTMKNLLTNSTSNSIKLGTITVSNTLGDSFTKDIYVYNFTPSGRNDIEGVDFSAHYFNVQKRYQGAITFRYYWDANNGRSSSSTDYTASVIHPSANQNSVIAYNKTAGTVYVPAVYNNAIGHAYLYARIVNSRSSEEFLLPIRQTNVMVPLEFKYSKINPKDIYDDLYGPDMEWCLYYHDGLQSSFYYRNTSYTISIEIEATDDRGCIRYVPTSNMIKSYPDTIGEWNKEDYPVSTGVETRDVLRDNSVIYISCSSTIPSAAWTFIPTANIDNYQGIR